MSGHTFNVAVTGNRPFMEYDYNTSLLVRNALPNVIKRQGKTDIKILKFARVTIDTYDDVRRVSNEIWSGRRALFLPEPNEDEREDTVHVDLILHLGMVALGWPIDTFRFETVARRDGYELPGDDGKQVDSKELKDLGLPPKLATSFDVEAGWRQDVPSLVSDDAGLYFCEFRLYSSLAEPLITEKYREKSGCTVFEHLPQAHTPQDVKLACDVTLAYIEGLVDSHKSKPEE